MGDMQPIGEKLVVAEPGDALALPHIGVSGAVVLASEILRLKSSREGTAGLLKQRSGTPGTFPMTSLLV